MRIGDVKLLTGVDTATIRYWEDRGLLKSVRTDNQYRNYTQDDVDLIIKIKRFREIGVPVADLKLWIDNIISTKQLLKNHLKVLEQTADENIKNRELINMMLAGTEPEITFEFFEENVLPIEGDLILGVDIGTTTISAQLISLIDNTPIHTYCIEHGAAIKDSNYPDAFAVDANKLCNMAIGIVKAAIGSYSNIVSIGFTGQMHGIVCLDSEGEILSPLYSWQNRFGNRKIGDETLIEEIEKISGIRLPTGYGLVTYYALKRMGLLPENTSKIACISDVAVMKLCSEKTPKCHITNAASLGFFDIKNSCFQYDALNMLDIDKDILPEIVTDYYICGNFESKKVAVSIGDNQAGVYASIRENQALLNIGTSGQVCVITDKPDFDKFIDMLSVEIRPFFDNKYICIGATICGGKALAALADLVYEITKKIGGKVAKSDIYRLINTSSEQAKGEIDVGTAFLGTRDNPAQKGKIEGLTLSNFNLAELSFGFCRGIVEELYNLYSVFKVSSPQSLVISGNAIRKNTALQRAAENIFGQSVNELDYTEEAAFGAALFGAISAEVIGKNDITNIIKYKQRAV